MPLIKSASAPSSMQAFSLSDIERLAKQVLVNAQRKADALLSAAQSEADRLWTQARAEGLAAGTKEGIEKGTTEGKKSGHDAALAEHKAELGAALATLIDASRQFEAKKADLEASAMRDLIQLGLAIAEKVTKRQAHIDPEVLVANLEGALQRILKFSDVRIAIHPSQMKTLQNELPRLQLAWPQLQHVRLLEDGNLPVGSCQVFSAQGMVDADLHMQLVRLAAEVLPGGER